MNLRSPDRIVDNVKLADKLCGDSANLHTTRARHLELHGNLIPHVFMGEVLARAGACILPGAENAGDRRAELSRIIATLEHAMGGGDRETCSVICISFVWDAEGEPFFAALRPMLGPLLSARVRTQPDADAARSVKVSRPRKTTSRATSAS
jgi:hypothetical protein